MPTPTITETINWTTLLSTVVNEWRPQLVDNAIGHIPTFGELNKAGNVRRRGGPQIVEPLLSDLPTTGRFITGAGTFPTTFEQIATTSRWEWKEVVQPIPLQMGEILKNMGSGQQIPIIAARVEAAERALWSLLGDATNGVLSNTGDALTGISGLQAIISTAPSANTVGGIAGTSVRLNDAVAYWQNIVGTAITAWNTNGIENIRDAVLQTDRGNDAVNLHITTRTAVLRLLNRLTATNQFNQPFPTAGPMATERLVSTGASKIDFEGAPVLHDANAPADQWRGINTRYLRLYFHEGGEFQARPFVPAQDNVTIVGAIYAMMELVTNRRRAHFVVSGADSAA